jgi:hypothetical protein
MSKLQRVEIYDSQYYGVCVTFKDELDILGHFLGRSYRSLSAAQQDRLYRVINSGACHIYIERDGMSLRIVAERRLL